MRILTASMQCPLFRHVIMIFCCLVLLAGGRSKAGVLTVNTNADNTTADAFLTLREAIILSNSGVGGLGRSLTAGELLLISGSVGSGVADQIEFAGAYTILLVNPLPVITDANTLIDGYSVSGSAPNTTPATSRTAGLNMIISVRLMGDGGVENGFAVDANGCVIRGMSITNFTGSGIIWLSSSTHTSGKVEGCYLGLTPAGAVAANAYGVTVLSNNSHIQIGGTTPPARNLISGNGLAGVYINGGDQCTIKGNFVGTNATGLADVGNGFDGVLIEGVSVNDTVGGLTTSHRNVISGNDLNGVNINAEGCDNTVIKNNFIGLGRDGTTKLGNLGSGVRVDGGADQTLIGGDWDFNFIGYNTDGIHLNSATTTLTVIAMNFIGLNYDGYPAANSSDGIQIDQSVTTTIGPKNRIAANKENGILIIASDAITIAGNFIGTDSSTVSPDLGNGLNGITITGAAANNIVGGPVLADRNFIVFNYNIGVEISEGSAANTVQNNYIGINRNGISNAGNLSTGLAIINGNVNTIGPGNVISGNDGCGVLIHGSGCHDNAIKGNLIGTTADGNTPLANDLDGVRIENINIPNAINNMVGGVLPSDRNIISGNKRTGVRLSGSGVTMNQILANYIGLNKTGTAAVKNDSAGIRIEFGAYENVIGHPTLFGAGNVVSGNGREGISVHGEGAVANEIYGNLIGLNATGSGAVANGSHGIWLRGGAFNTRIGKNTIAARNIISANNGHGVLVDSVASAKIHNNYMGTNGTGTAAVGNDGSGILVRTADNEIGLPGGGYGNLIAGNDEHGIIITDPGADGNSIHDNWIGQNSAGAPLGNGGDGIRLGNGIDNTHIGGTSGTAANVIRANSGSGVALANGAGTRNLISGNSIHGNGGLGIDINPLGSVNPNDSNDNDEGSNRKMNFPTIQYANWDTLSSTLTIRVRHNATTSRAKYPLTVEFFTGTADPSGAGEGETYLGKGIITMPNTTTTIDLPNISMKPGILTAVAIDDEQNTSEFSQNYGVTVPVEFLTFNAEAIDGTVILRWSTASESNNAGFEIERSPERDGMAPSWEMVGFVQGSGTTRETSRYSFIDTQDADGPLFYRLRQIDYDGSWSFSPVVSVSVSRAAVVSMEQNYPNPFSFGAAENTITIVIPRIKGATSVRLELMDALGRIQRTLLNTSLPEGRYPVALRRENLEAGLYFYRLTVGNRSVTQKLIIE